MTKIWINDKFVGIDKAKVSVFDRGFMYGDGAFETMRSYAGIVFKLDEHIDRLFKSLIILKIKAPCTKKYLKEAVYNTLKANRHCEGTTVCRRQASPKQSFGAYIKLTVTRGEGRFGISHKDRFFPNVVIVVKNFDGYPDWMFTRGLSAKVIGVQNEQSVISKIKSLNYLPYILARFDAKDKGYDEAILTNTKGYITEAPTSNIFLVKDDHIITPSINSGILPGITRGVIIGIAKKLRIKIIEKFVARKESMNADEAFLTNSLAEVLPVTKIDSKRVGSGEPGDITKLLHISYQKQVIREVLQ